MGTGPTSDGKFHRYQVGRRSKRKEYNRTSLTIVSGGRKGKKGVRISLNRGGSGRVLAAVGDMAATLVGLRVVEAKPAAEQVELKVELANKVRKGKAVGTLYGVAQYVGGRRTGWVLRPQDDESLARRVASGEAVKPAAPKKPTAKKSLPAAAKKKAAALGKAAHMAGRAATPALDAELKGLIGKHDGFASVLMDEWSSAWHKANAAKPAAPKKKPAAPKKKKKKPAAPKKKPAAKKAPSRRVQAKKARKAMTDKQCQAAILELLKRTPATDPGLAKHFGISLYKAQKMRRALKTKVMRVGTRGCHSVYAAKDPIARSNAARMVHAKTTCEVPGVPAAAKKAKRRDKPAKPKKKAAKKRQSKAKVVYVA